MDINKIVKSPVIKKRALPKLSIEDANKMVTLAPDDSYTQKDALLAVRKDPAVLDARISIDEKKSIPSTSKIYTSPSDNLVNSEASTNFDDKIRAEKAALFSLSTEQFGLLLKYVQILRNQRILHQRQMECRFCKNNRQPEVWYTTHVLKDKRGRVRCPVLRSFVCPRCGATGERAHTITHCPLKP